MKGRVKCVHVNLSQRNAKKKILVKGKKKLVGRCFKSKATRCAGFGTYNQNPYVKDTTEEDMAEANLTICIITLKPQINISVYF